MPSPIVTKSPGAEFKKGKAISSLAGRPAPKDLLVDVPRLQAEYFARRPDLGSPNQFVSFGMSGHRGTPLNGTFTESHILAMTQAICGYRRACGLDGPLYVGRDTRALEAQQIVDCALL